MPIQNPLWRCYRRLLKYRGIVLSGCCAVLLLGVNPVRADDKRVTVPLTLPFQHADQGPATAHSSAASDSAAAQAHAVKPMPFTRSGSVVATSAASVSKAAAVPAPKVAVKPIAAKPNAAKPSAAKPNATKLNAAKPSTVKAGTSTPAVAANAVVTVTPPPALHTLPIHAQVYPEGHAGAFVAEFEQYIATKIAPFVPGAAVVIVAQGEVKSLRTFGVRKSGGQDKVTPDTVFRLASVSKTVAATAAAIMVRDGHLAWDSKVTAELGNVKFKDAKYGNQITLKHLLSQSSGLPTHTYSHFIDNNMAYDETVRRLRYVNFVCPPGKCYAYQNVVYSLAGEMIKKKAGMSYENYVEKRLFGPLGMRSASFGLANYQASPNRATPHTASGNRWVPATVTNNWYHVPPAAGVNASIADMAQFLLAQLGQQQTILPSASLNQTQGRVTKNTPAQNHYGTRKGVDNTAYGLGWRVFDYGRHKNFVHHGGWVKGFRSEMVFNRDLQIGMVFLTNSESRRVRDVIFEFMDSHERAYQAAKQSQAANKP